MCVFSVNRRKNFWGDLGKFALFALRGEYLRTVLDSMGLAFGVVRSYTLYLS